MSTQKVLECFNLEKENNIFKDFYNLNERLNIFLNLMKDKMAKVESNHMITLNDTHKKLLNGKTKKDEISKKQLEFIILEEIRKVFGMNEECGIMKRYLFALLEVIQSDTQITFSEKNMTEKQSGGSSQYQETSKEEHTRDFKEYLHKKGITNAETKKINVKFFKIPDGNTFKPGRFYNTNYDKSHGLIVEYEAH